MRAMWRGWRLPHLSEAVPEGWRAAREEEGAGGNKKRVNHLTGTTVAAGLTSPFALLAFKPAALLLVNTHEDFHKILCRIVQHFLTPSS